MIKYIRSIEMVMAATPANKIKYINMAPGSENLNALKKLSQNLAAEPIKIPPFL
jgi:hypothetical protein